jgi:hypothetical protein
MSNTIQIKRSSTSGSVPTAGQLAQGELAVNLANEALYTKDASNAVVKLNAPSIDDKNTGATKHVTIDASGNVGIGTSSPAQKLSVTGNIAATGSIDCGTQFLGLSTDTAAAPSFSFTGDTDTGMYRAGTNTLGLTTGGTVRLSLSTSSLVSTLPFDAPDGTAGVPAFTFSGDTDTGIFRPSANTLAFTGGGDEAMRITSGGDLRVGATTTAFSERLLVRQTGTSAAAQFYKDNTNTNQVIIVLHGGVTGSATGTMINFLRATGVSVGSITSTTTATSYVTSSDYRLKHDIQPMTGALAKVAQLKPVTYKWNEDDSQSQGFIAHELQEVVPECVTGEKDAVDAEGNPQYQGIDTSFLVATLVSAIQEQQQIITALTARVEVLEGAK